ncbi:DUF4389 domain-containing protein [Magnetovibrio sp.]|uniref:DUF4389 domain-containing protein n=1 Tax=Magnetovibrio sp. TaxID=2024836 RepID=UPI002F936681
MQDQTRDNLTDKSTWMRLIYIVLFAIAFNIAEILIAMITVVQFFTVLFTKAPNARLQTLGGDLGGYIRDVTAFLTFQTDHMPYPVSDWGQQEPEPEPAPEPAAKKTTTRKPAAKKKPATKKAPPKTSEPE